MKKNIWMDGVFGVVVGDALGCPVQFQCREIVADHPVTAMRGYGTFDLPAGSWTDDSSLTLALLDSIVTKGRIDLNHIMGNFADWLDHGAYTPYGYAYDIGQGTMQAIRAYKRTGNPLECGSDSVQNNGNGSLMRILPACLYCYRKGLNDSDATRVIHAVGSLTHAHIRAGIACGLYWFMVKAVLDGKGDLTERLQAGLDHGFAWYQTEPEYMNELACYSRLHDLEQFVREPADSIRSNGYVVHTIEAAVWSLITTGSFENALLKAVNLGYDTDTVAAVAGGLAGLFYGYDAIPAAWLTEIKKREWMEKLCESANAAL